MAGTASADAEVWLDCANELGEGPVAHPDRQSLVWVDILQRRLFERAFEGGGVRIHKLDVMASAVALVDQCHVLLATEVDLRLFDLDRGTARPVCPFLEQDPHLRSNDGRVHPSGAFWISSMGRNSEAHAGAVWWFRESALRLLFDGITTPNAISFAPGGGAAYFADSSARTIWRVAVARDTGLPTGEPDIFAQPDPEDGTPDGAVVDADGNLWTAAWGVSAINTWAPDGRLAGRFKLPVSQPTCPAFFGPRLDELVVTSSREKLNAEALAAEPCAGSVLKLRRIVRGAPEPFASIA